MGKPVIASATPYPLEVRAGQTYLWCACGLSKDQPFCDGSHKDGPFQPVRYQAPTDKIVFFCGCKHTASAPVCDGQHTQAASQSKESDA